MIVVVDANIVLSALLSKGKSFDVFAINKFVGTFEFIAPEYLFLEIGKNFGEIVERSKLSSEELAKVFGLIKDEVEFIPFKEFNKHNGDAEKIAPHPKDVQYFALALASNCGIWSTEKAFRKQSRVKIFSTQELINVLSKTFV